MNRDIQQRTASHFNRTLLAVASLSILSALVQILSCVSCSQVSPWIRTTRHPLRTTINRLVLCTIRPHPSCLIPTWTRTRPINRRALHRILTRPTTIRPTLIHRLPRLFSTTIPPLRPSTHHLPTPLLTLHRVTYRPWHHRRC